MGGFFLLFIFRVLKELISYLRNHYSVSEEEAQIISRFFTIEKMAKGASYVKEGAICDKLSFVTKGMLRVYKTVNDKEVTQWISTPGFFATDIASLMFGVPSRWTIHAIDDSEVFTISQRDYLNLKNHLSTWPEIEKRFITKCFVSLEERVFSQLSLSTEEQYDQLMKYSGSLVREVPHST